MIRFLNHFTIYLNTERASGQIVGSLGHLWEHGLNCPRRSSSKTRIRGQHRLTVCDLLLVKQATTEADVGAIPWHRNYPPTSEQIVKE